MLLLGVKISIAQQYIEISGKVIDVHTKAALPFASIKILHSTLGVFTNLEGLFYFKIPEIHRKDTLEISFLGFKSKKFCIFDCKNPITVALAQSNIELGEVKIIPASIQTVILKALSRIPENYPTYEANFIAYFKETITENDSIIQHIEAILSIFKRSYIENSKDRVGVVKAKEFITDKNASVWKYLHFIDGPYEMLFADFVKNPTNFLQVPDCKINFLNPRHFKFYHYETDTSYKNQFVIQFRPANRSRRVVFEGTLFIDKLSLAFDSLKFHFSPLRMEQVRESDSETEMALATQEVYIVDSTYQLHVFYSKFGNERRLSRIQQSYSFTFQENNNPKTLIRISDEFSVISIDTANLKPISVFKRISVGVPLPVQITKNDSNEWESSKIMYGIIKK